MQTLTVGLGDRSYPILIGQNLLDNKHHWQTLGESIALPKNLLVVSDDQVAPLYLEKLQKGLAEHRIDTHTIQAGEASKTMESLSLILDQLVDDGFQRDGAIIALGGGVVGDMAGFAAACYMRGIRFVQVPTTLLAQVDSSVGGKTGVNHALGKNLIGAFHQPIAVVIDTDTLTTLDARELRAGLAEVIKYGCIYDDEFFAWLEKNIPALLKLDSDALSYAIQRSCQIKADIVARDEKEQGERALLNFGHSFGHAIEQTTGYTLWLHGEAVAIGMLMASYLSLEMNLIKPQQHDRIVALVQAAGLPDHTGGIDADSLESAMQKDKKNLAGQQRLIVLNDIGRSSVRNDCTVENIRTAIARFN